MPVRKTTVILPVKNGELYITEAIQSVLNQTYPYFDLVIIDASDDHTPEIVHGFRDNRIIYHRQESKGSAQGYNEAYEKFLTGEYVTFIHHDDQYAPNKLYEQIMAFEEFWDVDCVYNDIFYGDTAMEYVKQDHHEDYYLRTNDLIPQQLLHTGIRNGGMNMMIKSSFVKCHKLRFSTDYPMICDEIFVVDLALAGAKFKLVPQLLYRYRLHGSNASKDMEVGEKQIVRWLRGLGEEKIQAFVNATSYSESTKDCLMLRILTRMEYYSQAQAYFENAPYSSWLGFYMALCWYRQREYAKSAELQKRCCSERPYISEFWNNLGCYQLLSQNNVTEARACFETAIRIEQRLFGARYNFDRLKSGESFQPSVSPTVIDVVKMEAAVIEKNISRIIQGERVF